MSKFPIKRIIVENESEYLKVLNEGDVVNCYFCGEPIVIDNDSIRFNRGTELIHCGNPVCRRDVDAFYYLIQQKTESPLKKPLKRKRSVKKTMVNTIVK